VFRRRRFLTGTEAEELCWFTPAGIRMGQADWNNTNSLALAIYLDGSDDPDPAADGTPLLDDDFLVLVNAWWEPLDFTIPEIFPGQSWLAEIDTHDLAAAADSADVPGRHTGDRVTVGPRSITVLRGPRPLVPAPR
jgi:glycogen operon protein